MTEHERVPNLQELDGKEAYSFLTDVFYYGPVPDPEVVYEANHPEDYAMEMPQSGERIVGRENMRRFHKAYPGGGPTIRVRRVVVRDGLWVVEGVKAYGGGQVSDFVMILELKDGKIWRDRRYYAEPFEAPEWRAEWVDGAEF